jgi:hypothetical protein
MARLVQLPATCPADEGEVLVINYLKDQLPNTYN